MDVPEKEQTGCEEAAGHWYYRAKFGGSAGFLTRLFPRI